ncbi:MFS transporter, partial [Phaeovulum sp.]|uniref:MFS transporter n=1 Tax=Phaeovulum sp. TaxID=2934796 RepID=UPI003561F284
MTRHIAALGPFRHKTFRQLWAASQASNLGSLIQAVGAAWMMTSLTSSPSMIALVQASTTLPVMLFSLSAGALADSFDRRRIMLVAQSFMLVVSVALTAAAYAGMLTPWTLLGFTFLIGVGTALNNPSWQASMGDIVPRQDLPEAVSMNAMGFNLMRSVGPALGGIIVALAGAAVAFAVNALSYFPLLGALLVWRPEPRSQSMPREPFGPAVTAGLRYVVMSPNLLRVMLRGMVFGLGAVSVLALLPLIARDLVQGGPFIYGVLLGCFGLGAIFGGLLNARIRRMMRNEWVVRWAFVGFAGATLILSQSASLLVSVVPMMLAGASWVLALSLFNVTVQLSSPRWVVGRALAMYQMATFGGMAAGSWIWGATAEVFGTHGALIASGLFLLLGAVVGKQFEMPEFGTVDLDPLNSIIEPPLELNLRGRSGPILVMIDYQIAPADIPVFLATMTERRRTRRRDGARHWALLRDLEHPDQWTESYHLATW